MSGGSTADIPSEQATRSSSVGVLGRSDVGGADRLAAVDASASALSRSLRVPSRSLLRFFDFYLSLYVPLHFRALRIAHPERFPLAARPLIVVINHPSWWDPLTSILLSRFFLRQANHYAPIDAMSLPRHRILAGLGLFPVEQGTPRGAVQFLRTAQHILADPDSVLWLTPQGAFTDVRTRPVQLKAGLASLLKRLDQVTVLPLAYEYPFWDEPRPEMLALCGQPLVFARGQLAEGDLGPGYYANSHEGRIPEASGALAGALAQAQDELATLVTMRRAEHFTTVMAGELHVGVLRAAWLHLLAALRPRSYKPRATTASVPGQPPVAGDAPVVAGREPESARQP